jgi:hypothetical protein
VYWDNAQRRDPECVLRGCIQAHIPTYIYIYIYIHIYGGGMCPCLFMLHVYIRICIHTYLLGAILAQGWRRAAPFSLFFSSWKTCIPVHRSRQCRHQVGGSRCVGHLLIQFGVYRASATIRLSADIRVKLVAGFSSFGCRPTPPILASREIVRISQRSLCSAPQHEL